MQNIKGLLFAALILFSACSGGKGKKAEVKQESPETKQVPVTIGTETALLLKDLSENGDYVNSKEFPSLIKASIVYESIGKNIQIIDLRPAKQFSDGHIKGAINKKFQDLPEYFESGIKPFEFEKIVLVCNDGQLSAFTASLLRLMGYGNVYSMRWGMSAWNSKYAKEGWLSAVSGKYETSLETKPNEHPVAKGMPELNTGLSTGAEIGSARFRKVFAEGPDNVLISSDEVFSDPGKYYIINLERKDKYEDGHIPGAVRYKPEATLGFTDEMASIPFDKTIVVYCGSGHNSGFATAYLRLFGYNAKTLRFGNNGFMHEKMVQERTALSWLPFTSEEVNDFPVVK